MQIYYCPGGITTTIQHAQIEVVLRAIDPSLDIFS
jgi:hypothetical protein